MGEEGLAASVVDTGALIAIDRGDERLRRFLRSRLGPFIVPAAVLAQAWRDGRVQARLARFIAAAGTTIEVLDEASAKAIGVTLARSGTADIVDASVVVTARRYQALVLTSDPDDLLRIYPSLEFERV